MQSKMIKQIKQAKIIFVAVVKKLSFSALFLMMLAPCSAGLTINVTSDLDSGPGTLREAIDLANGTATPYNSAHIILFDSPLTILLNTHLEALTYATKIKGESVPGYSGVPLVTLDLSSIQSQGVGLQITGYSSIKGIEVVNGVNSGSAGFSIYAGGYSSIDNCVAGNCVDGFICSAIGYCGISTCISGFDKFGLISNPNIGIGISVSGNNIGVNNNMIGGGQTGVEIVNGSTGSNVFENFVGLNNVGSVTNGCLTSIVDHGASTSILNNTICNSEIGVLINGQSVGSTISNNLIGFNPNSTDPTAHGNQIGISDLGTGTIINGNTICNSDVGVILQQTSTDCTIENNSIGYSSISAIPQDNGNDIGVKVQGQDVTIDNNQIGNSTTDGIQVFQFSDGVTIINNSIGVTEDELHLIPNFNGIDLVPFDSDAAKNVVIGRTNDGNTICGNTNDEVGCYSEFGATIQSNLIGPVTPSLMALSPVSNNGIYCVGSFLYDQIMSDLIIGGSSINDRNVIGGHTTFGVFCQRVNSADIKGNYIGTQGDGVTPSFNQFGIYIVSSSGNLKVGGSGINDGNIIVGSSSTAEVFFNSCDDAVISILGNRIGIAKDDLTNLANSNIAGVFLPANPNIQLTIGDGSTEFAGNVISGYQKAIHLIGNSNSSSTIKGNVIGLNKDGSMISGTTTQAIFCSNTPNVTIGGTEINDRNVISGIQSGNAIGTETIRLEGCNNSAILGNFIGVDVNGVNNLPHGNMGPAISASSCDNFQLGNSNAGNVISANNLNNQNAGNVMYLAGQNYSIQSNLIGTDATGTYAIPNLGQSLIQGSMSNSVIGGENTGDGNIIAGNSFTDHIFRWNGGNGLIEGNTIGLNSGGSELTNGDLDYFFTFHYATVNVGGDGVKPNKFFGYNKSAINFSSGYGSGLVSQNIIYTNSPQNEGGIIGSTATLPTINPTSSSCETFGTVSGAVSGTIELFRSDVAGLNAYEYLASADVNVDGTWSFGCVEYSGWVVATYTNTSPVRTSNFSLPVNISSCPNPVNVTAQCTYKNLHAYFMLENPYSADANVYYMTANSMGNSLGPITIPANGTYLLETEGFGPTSNVSFSTCNGVFSSLNSYGVCGITGQDGACVDATGVLYSINDLTNSLANYTFKWVLDETTEITSNAGATIQGDNTLPQVAVDFGNTTSVILYVKIYRDGVFYTTLNKTVNISARPEDVTFKDIKVCDHMESVELELNYTLNIGDWVEFSGVGVVNNVFTPLASQLDTDVQIDYVLHTAGGCDEPGSGIVHVEATPAFLTTAPEFDLINPCPDQPFFAAASSLRYILYGVQVTDNPLATDNNATANYFMQINDNARKEEENALGYFDFSFNSLTPHVIKVGLEHIPPGENSDTYKCFLITEHESITPEYLGVPGGFEQVCENDEDPHVIEAVPSGYDNYYFYYRTGEEGAFEYDWIPRSEEASKSPFISISFYSDIVVVVDGLSCLDPNTPSASGDPENFIPEQADGSLIYNAYVIKVQPTVCPPECDPLVDDCDYGCSSCMVKLFRDQDEYYVSAWTKENGNSEYQVTYQNAQINVRFELDGEEVVTEGHVNSWSPSGPIIDGWQKIEGKVVVPAEWNGAYIDLMGDHTSPDNIDILYDDIRFFPLNSNMVSYVYDPITLRLMAQMDENNNATFYEYDKEGKLVRVKKETERGIMTLQESRDVLVKQN